MYKKIILFYLLCNTNLLKAQVGINTENPRGALEVFSKIRINDTVNSYSGLVLPIVDSVDIVSSPNSELLSPGTLVFSKKDHCLAVRGNTDWDGCLTTLNNVENFFDYEVWGGVNFKARKIVAGDNFTLSIDNKTGALYSSGYNYAFRTGNGSNGSTHSFQLIFTREVIDVSAGYHHSLLTDKDGNLYTWGWNSNSVLGLQNVTYRAYPYKISYFPSNTKIVRVEASYDTSLVMDSEGGVWFAGYGGQGISGSGTSNVNLFTKVNFPEGVTAKDIALGAYGAAIVTPTGDVYTWGNNGYGRLGNTLTSTITTSSPTKIVLPSAVRKVIIGNRYGLAISEDGKQLYGWGDPVGWGDTSLASGSASIIDITDKIFYNVENKNAHLDDDFKILDIATDQITLSTSTSVSSVFVSTTKGIFAVGGNGRTSKLGLGAYKGTDSYIYSPNGVLPTQANYTRFFMPLYNNSIFPGTTFQQISVGTQHTVFLQSTDSEGNGGFAQGTGWTIYNQLGGVSTGYIETQIPVFLKK